MPLALSRRSTSNDCALSSPIRSLKLTLPPPVIGTLLESIVDAREEVTADRAPQRNNALSAIAAPSRLLAKSLGVLQPGSTFVGKQTNKEQNYNVKVEIKHVDLAESLVCGYLHIEDLTAFCPTLTTYFEGEVISGPGGKYSFHTRKWDTDEEVDRAHWEKFPSFKPYVTTFNSDDFEYDPFGKDEGYLFMRWKEMFLVPDHRVESVLGASFAGFYYICFDMRMQTISGLYYHQDSERFQSLELKHVPKCTSGSFEFR